MTFLTAALVSAVIAFSPGNKRRAELNCVKALYTTLDKKDQIWRQRCNRPGSSAPSCGSLPPATLIDGRKAVIDRKTCQKFYMGGG